MWIWTVSYTPLDVYKRQVDGCVSFFEPHVHLGGELHVPHDCADPVHGAHAGAVAHELQADFFEVAALGGHGHRLGVENLTLALVHAEADGTDEDVYKRQVLHPAPGLYPVHPRRPSLQLRVLAGLLRQREQYQPRGRGRLYDGAVHSQPPGRRAESPVRHHQQDL